MRGLGLSLLRVCRGVPGGLLCFFASYSQLHSCLQAWRKKQGNKSLSASSCLSAADPASSSSSFSQDSVKEDFFPRRPAASPPSYFGFARKKREEEKRGFPAQAGRTEKLFDESSSSSSYLQGWKDEKEEDSSLLSEIEKVKKVFIEPANSRDMGDLLLSFQQAVQEAYRGKEKRAKQRLLKKIDATASRTTGALLLAVCKGKAAEGMEHRKRKRKEVFSLKQEGKKEKQKEKGRKKERKNRVSNACVQMRLLQQRKKTRRREKK